MLQDLQEETHFSSTELEVLLHHFQVGIQLSSRQHGWDHAEQGWPRCSGRGGPVENSCLHALSMPQQAPNEPA